MVIATVLVGWTSTRPVIPDEHVSRVIIAAETEHAAELLAVQMVASRPTCQMPTSSQITDLIL